MIIKTETLTVSLVQLYSMTSHPHYDTGYTHEEISALIEEYGQDHQIETTVTISVPESSEELMEETVELEIEEPPAE